MFVSDFGMLRLRERNSYTHTFAEMRSSQLYVGYGKPEGGFSIIKQPLKDVPEQTFYAKEFLYIIADCRTQEVTIQRDALSTLPLFAGVQDGHLVFSNHFERTYDLLDQTRLTLDAATLTIALLQNNHLSL